MTTSSGPPVPRLALGAWLCLLPLGCRQPEDAARPPVHSQLAPAAPTDAPGPVASGSASPAEHPKHPGVEWASWRGRCVRLQGYAAGQKIGPLLISGSFSLGVALPGGGIDDWGVPLGARVSVEGVVVEKADLPVFVQEPGEPIEQGMPVPKGTDLEKARRRFVLEARHVSLVRSLADVEAALLGQVGAEVSLAGVVWSLNGHYWFSHDGVDLHLAGREKIAGWEGLHGEPVTLRGRLDRRPMPRLDELTLRASPALADAFVLELSERAPHPDWPVEPCPEGH